MLKPTESSRANFCKLYNEKPGSDNWISALADAVVSAKILQDYFQQIDALRKKNKEILNSAEASSKSKQNAALLAKA